MNRPDSEDDCDTDRESESKTNENKGGDDVEEQVGKSGEEESALLASLVLALKHKEQLLTVCLNNPLKFIITNDS